MTRSDYYAIVEVPGYYEDKTCGHDVCLKDGFDFTQGYLDSIKDKTYPDYDEEPKKNGDIQKKMDILKPVMMLIFLRLMV